MSGSSENHKRKILIADADKDSLIIHRTFFNSIGFDVITAENGLDSLHLSYNEQPDIIIMDSHMPKMNGYESCRLLKHDALTSNIPIILLSPPDLNRNQYWGLDVGADKYLVKNYHLPTLAQAVQSLCESNSVMPVQTNPTKFTDIDIFARVNRILDHKLIESSIINKIIDYANSLGDYEQIMRNIFYVLNNMFSYSTLAIYLHEGKCIFIDTLSALKEEYIDWVIFKIHKDCEFDYRYVQKKTVFERENEGHIMWDTMSSIWTRKLMIKDTYLGALIITTIHHGGFSEDEQVIFEAIINPLITILDNTRMYSHIEHTNSLLEAFQKDLIEFNRTLDHKIEERTLQLQKLYDAGRALTTIHEPSRLLATLINMIINSTGAEVGSAILLERGEVSKKIEFGLSFEVLKEIRLKDEARTPLYKEVIRIGEPMILNQTQTNEQLDLTDVTARNFMITSLACIPFKTAQSVIGLLMIVNKSNNNDFTKDDALSLTTLSSMAAVAIENANLYEQTIAKTKLEADIKVAMKMQTDLLPKASPQSDYFEVASRYTPAELVGGDYYDYIALDQDNTGFVMADVTGHGVSAAFTMTQVKTCMQLISKGIFSTKEVVHLVNYFMYTTMPKTSFVSLLYAILNTKNRTLLYTSAGHNPSLCFSQKKDEFKLISSEGLFLNLFDNTQYGEISIPYSAGDIFVFYTDGLTEAINSRKEQFGLEKVQEIVRKNADLSANNLASEIYAQLKHYIGRCSLRDDLTFTVLKIKQ